MSNAPTAPAVNSAQAFPVTVVVRDRVNPANIDPTTPLSPTSSDPATATAAVNPTNNREVIITGQGPGVCTITIQEVPPTPNPLTVFVPVTAAPPPDQSRVDFVSYGAVVPK